MEFSSQIINMGGYILAYIIKKVSEKIDLRLKSIVMEFWRFQPHTPTKQS